MECEECRFLKPKILPGRPPLVGECRRYAPKPNSPYSEEGGKIFNLRDRTDWPVVELGCWCGEFETKK